ncbi:MAG: hypothetical protein G3M78_00930 [Candidatus Nitrohelix vancouverensis]|uniref:Glycosyltransferase RgtA/B/C/D-like domain-containing protein n=1 Tax=Candidatus Nitrohelix vancouverensis TaxID=2705534 RepID=A0A7T0C020_9BACT|nr:MAG: hypothetical protein G3M78_00930 [Candidatus Nitrohelix vancouverensis]
MPQSRFLSFPQVLFPFLVLTLTYVVSRYWGLDSFPVFSDEAIYINIAQIVSENGFDMALFRMEGKHPLYMWFVVLALNFFNDPLLAGRAVSILAGFATLVGMYQIARREFSPKEAWVCALLVILCPFFLFHDRLAMVDSLMCALAVWSVVLALSLADDPGRATARSFGIGLLLGAAFFTKGNAILFFPVPLVFLFLMNRPTLHEFLRWGSLIAAGVLLWTLPLYLWGKEISFYHAGAALRWPEVFLTLEEIASVPLEQWKENFLAMCGFYISYLTLPLCLILILSVVLVLKEKRKFELALLVWAFAPPLLIVLVSKGFYSRYLLMFVPPLILLVSMALLRISQFVQDALERRSPDGARRMWAQPAILAALMLVSLQDAFFLPRNSQTIL